MGAAARLLWAGAAPGLKAADAGPALGLEAVDPRDLGHLLHSPPKQVAGVLPKKAFQKLVSPVQPMYAGPYCTAVGKPKGWPQ